MEVDGNLERIYFLSADIITLKPRHLALEFSRIKKIFFFIVNKSVNTYATLLH